MTGGVRDEAKEEHNKYKKNTEDGDSEEGKKKKKKKKGKANKVKREIIPAHGCDVLRMFFASADYTSDIPVSTSTLTKAKEVVHKVYIISSMSFLPLTRSLYLILSPESSLPIRVQFVNLSKCRCETHCGF